MSETDSEAKLTNIPMGKPEIGLGVSNQLLTVAADYMKVLIDRDGHSCTFLVYQKHPLAKQSDRGLILGGFQEEEILEIKITMESAFALSEYMHIVLRDYQKDPNVRGRVDFGPTSIQEVKK